MTAAAVVTVDNACGVPALARASTVTRTTCGYSHLDYVTAAELEGADIGALELDEPGWIGRCLCGWRTEVRYSPIAAQSAVAVHALGKNPLV